MKYILMDLDGTITNPAEGITKCFEYALNHFGIEVENRADLEQFIGPPLRKSFMDGFGFDEEKAEQAVTEEDAKKMEKKFRENSFTLDDYLVQFETMKKMGGLKDVLSMLPGMGKFKIREEDIDEKKMLQMKAIIQSMTMKERQNPSIINASRKIRIAKGSGTSVQEVNRVLKQFEQTKQMMKQMKNNRMFRF